METPNFTIIDEYANGDPSIKKMLLKIIVEEFPTEKEKYYTNYKDKDFLKTKEIVHKLKNKIRVLGLSNGCKIAVDYEKQLRDKNASLHNEFDQILQTISDFVEDIKTTLQLY